MNQLACFLIAVLCLTACQEGGSVQPSSQVVACVGNSNQLIDPAFSRSAIASGQASAWAQAQHSGEISFVATALDGMLTIEKIATQPWFTYTQILNAKHWIGQTLVFSAELKLNLNAENLGHNFKAGAGLQVTIAGDADPVTGDDRLLYESSLEHEPHLGVVDWTPVSVRFVVPEKATRLTVGFMHQANGTMSVRNPVLRVCGAQ